MAKTAAEYQALLEQLQHGKISQLEISKEEFMQFQPVLMQFAKKKSVVGHAKRGGGAIFTFNDQSKLS